MTPDETILHLERWQSVIQAAEEQLGHLSFVVSSDCDGPLFEAQFRLIDAYTSAVSEIVGDKGEWLSWYANECEFGNDPQQARANETDQLHQVDNLEKLERLIRMSK